MELVEAGVLEEHGVELIGARAEAIATAEDRHLFKEAMLEIGLKVPSSGIAHTLEEARLSTIRPPESDTATLRYRFA